MALSLVFFAVGFFILIQGASVLVRGAASFAERLRISGFVIGMLVAGIGTSIPEFSIALLGNFVGESDVAFGTIIGSNTFNILFILGVAAIVTPLPFRPSWVRRDLVWNVVAVLLVAVFALADAD